MQSWRRTFWRCLKMLVKIDSKLWAFGNHQDFALMDFEAKIKPFLHCVNFKFGNGKRKKKCSWITLFWCSFLNTFGLYFLAFVFVQSKNLLISMLLTAMTYNWLLYSRDHDRKNKWSADHETFVWHTWYYSTATCWNFCTSLSNSRQVTLFVLYCSESRKEYSVAAMTKSWQIKTRHMHTIHAQVNLLSGAHE